MEKNLKKKRYKKTGKNIQGKGNQFKRGERRRTNRVTLAFDKDNKKKLIRKLSNFTFQWTKTSTLYQSILSPTLFKGYKCDKFT